MNQSFWQLSNQSLDSVCPGFAEPRSQSDLASADQCRRFCDVTPSATTLSTLNNPRDLDLDWTVREPDFWFSELRHIGMQISDSMV